MKVLRTVFIWMNFILAVLAAAILVLSPKLVAEPFKVLGEAAIANSPAESVRGMRIQLDQVRALTLASVVVGDALLWGCLLFLWASIRSLGRGSYSSSLEFSDSEGGFKISTKALEQTLARAVQKLSEVQDLRVVVHARHPDGTSPIHVVATGAVFQNNDLHSVREKICDTLRRSFQGMLRLEESVRFDVDIQRIVPKGKERREAPVTESGDSEPDESLDFPITGPVYPVDTEDEETPPPTS